MRVDHLTVPVCDYALSKGFYERALAPLRFSLRLDWPDKRRAFFGLPGEPSALWLTEAPVAGSLELSLVATEAADVERFHSAAIAAGGTSEQAPGVREEYSSGYFAARVRDPDGNAIEVVFRNDTAASSRRSLAA